MPLLSEEVSQIQTRNLSPYLLQCFGMHGIARQLGTFTIPSYPLIQVYSWTNFLPFIMSRKQQKQSHQLSEEDGTQGLYYWIHSPRPLYNLNFKGNHHLKRIKLYVDFLNQPNTEPHSTPTAAAMLVIHQPCSSGS